MADNHIELKFLKMLREGNLTPEELFLGANVEEHEGRDVLSRLIDGGRVIVGKGWKLRLSDTSSKVPAHA